jgi:RimJ/RimL family protein N-acetyltransferase
MILETDRLTLEPLALSDFDAQHALWSQEPVYRHITGKPMSREEVWLRLLRDIGHWQALGHGNWSVKLKTTGQHIGVIGVFDFQREIDPPLDALETGWVFDAAIHGQGYASEALKATLAFADQTLKARRTLCMINPDNASSLKLAERHGYKRLRTSLFHSQPVLVLERLADGRIS